MVSKTNLPVPISTGGAVIAAPRRAGGAERRRPFGAGLFRLDPSLSHFEAARAYAAAAQLNRASLRPRFDRRA